MKPEVMDESSEVSGDNRRAALRPGFELPESKFHPLAARPGIVSRTALVDRLAAAEAPVITVVAPPGYGKTTLMAQWAERIGPRVAWVSCDEGDNDPVVLLSALAVALDRIEPVDPDIFWALASSGAGITAVPRFVSAVASMERPVTVLLDHAEAVTNKQCLNVIAELANQGYDTAHVARDLLALLRDLVVAKVCKDPSTLLDLADEEVRDVQCKRHAEREAGRARPHHPLRPLSRHEGRPRPRLRVAFATAP